MLRVLSSIRLANLIILVYCIFLIIAMLKPEKKLLDSIWFFILGILFFFNLTACTLKQLVNYRKNKIGLALFHIGLVLVLLGNGINFFWGKEGILQLGLGQTRIVDKSNLLNYREGKFASPWEGDLEITLQDIKVEKDQGKPKVKYGNLLVVNRQTNAIAQIPFDYVNSFQSNGLYFWPLERGYAPVLELTDELIHWSLQTKKLNNQEVYEGNLKTGDLDLKGQLKEQKLILIYQQGKETKEKVLSQGQTVFINGQQIKWLETSYWLAFSVKYQPGNSIIWPGTLLLIIGSAYHYLPLLWKKG